MSRWPVPARWSKALLAALVGGVAGACAVAVRWPIGDWRLWLPDLLVGWAFLASGALIGSRPGGGRQGGLVAAVGAAWFLADIVAELALLHVGVLVHASVAMPRGRVSTRLGRALVVAGYGCVLLEWSVPSPLVPLGMAVGLMGMARVSSGPRRSACLLVGALLVTDALAHYAAGATVEEAVLLLYEAGLAVVAVAFAAIVVRASSRSDVTDLVVEMGPQDALAELTRSDPTVHEDPALPAAVAAADRLRAANAQLTRDLEDQIAAVDASRGRLQAVQDQERATLEDRLRHGPAGRLDRVAADLAGQTSDIPEAVDRLAAARSQVSAARADLSRIARGLYPGAIADGSLESALRSIASSSPIPVELDLRVTRVGPAAAAVVYFVCSEAVVNAARHSQATRVAIVVERRSGEGSGAQVVVEVADDGIGGAAVGRGSGLQGLADRVAIGGGVLTLDSGPSGTRIVANVPDDPDEPGDPDSVTAVG